MTDRGWTPPGAWIDETHGLSLPKVPKPMAPFDFRSALISDSPVTDAITIEINRLVRDMVGQERDAMESLCWQALSDPGRRGIVVIEHPLEFDTSDAGASNEYRMSVTQHVEMRLDHRVPSMNIYRFPSREAYDAWIERGCPHG
jgi:hypothetical protein